jgi:hypothetical protein
MDYRTVKMRNIVNVILMATLLLTTSHGFSKDITPLQLLFVAKKVFAEKQKAYVMIDKKGFREFEEGLKRASVQMQVELQIYLIGGKADVGNAFKEIEDNSLLIIFDSAFLTESSTKLYVLSKCKDNRISIVTSSKHYGDSGALLTLFNDELGNTKIQLNLQKNEDHKDRFTKELIENSGINEVLM